MHLSWLLLILPDHRARTKSEFRAIARGNFLENTCPLVNSSSTDLPDYGDGTFHTAVSYGSVTAVYAGDSNFAGSKSKAVEQVVEK
jgi:hypothetical protein